MRVLYMLHNRLGCEYLHLARIAIHHSAHIARCSIITFICRNQRRLKRVDQDFLADAALLLDCIERFDKFSVH